MEPVLCPFLIVVLSPRPFLFSPGFLNINPLSEALSKMAAISPYHLPTGAFLGLLLGSPAGL